MGLLSILFVYRGKNTPFPCHIEHIYAYVYSILKDFLHLLSSMSLLREAELATDFLSVNYWSPERHYHFTFLCFLDVEALKNHDNLKEFMGLASEK